MVRFNITVYTRFLGSGDSNANFWNNNATLGSIPIDTIPQVKGNNAELVVAGYFLNVGNHVG